MLWLILIVVLSVSGCLFCPQGRCAHGTYLVVVDEAGAPVSEYVASAAWPEGGDTVACPSDGRCDPRGTRLATAQELTEVTVSVTAGSKMATQTVTPAYDRPLDGLGCRDCPRALVQLTVR